METKHLSCTDNGSAPGDGLTPRRAIPSQAMLALITKESVFGEGEGPAPLLFCGSRR